MEFTRHFCVRSIASEPFERFSSNFTQLFLSVRRCVEPMTQLRSLKVKPEGDTSMLLGFCSGGFRCLQTAVPSVKNIGEIKTSEITRPSFWILDHHHL